MHTVLRDLGIKKQKEPHCGNSFIKLFSKESVIEANIIN
jgi:hypothetical protein